MPKRMPRAVLAYLRKMGKAYGSQGGKTAAKNMTAAARKARARKASLAAAKKRTAQRLTGAGARDETPDQNREEMMRCTAAHCPRAVLNPVRFRVVGD